MKSDSEREDGLNQYYATSYRPTSTATILDSQVAEVIDMEPAVLLECHR